MTPQIHLIPLKVNVWKASKELGFRYDITFLFNVEKFRVSKRFRKMRAIEFHFWDLRMRLCAARFDRRTVHITPIHIIEPMSLAFSERSVHEEIPFDRWQLISLPVL
jgi:hypothetical protein